jgi:hypothetical protein
MTESFFTISFQHGGLEYNGRVSPEKKDADGNYTSWHVVLNDIFFGYLSRTPNNWSCTEWRPEELVAIVGEQIDQHKKEA